MLKILEKLIWKMQIVAFIVLIIIIVWYFVDFRSFPLWLAQSLAGYEIFFTIYYVIKKKRNE